MVIRPWLGANLQCISQHSTESALYPLCQPGIKSYIYIYRLSNWTTIAVVVQFVRCIVLTEQQKINFLYNHSAAVRPHHSEIRSFVSQINTVNFEVICF